MQPTTESFVAFLKTAEGREILEHARETFEGAVGKEALGFNEYLLYDHVEGGRTLHERLTGDRAQTYTSFFERLKVPGKTVLKDLFTKADLQLEEEIGLQEGILFLKLERVDGTYRLLSEPLSLESTYRQQVTKLFYDAIKEDSFIGDPADFVRDHPLLMYGIYHILTEAVETLSYDEQHMVYQSVYQILSEEAFSKGKDCETIVNLEDEDYDLFNLMAGEEVVAQVLRERARLEVEARTPELRELAKQMMTACFGESIRHLTDDLITLDDLL